MAKRNKGILLIIIGCVLLTVAAGWYAYNIIEDQNAGKQAAEILEKFDAAKEEATPQQDESVIVVEDDTFCGKVTVEKLGIELPVYNEWNYSRLKKAPCRYMGTIFTDDIIIAAHNFKTHFGTLNKLEVGDEISFTDAAGKIHYYTVGQVTILDGTAVSDMQSGGWDMTLFTCTKGGEQRVTIRCERKNEES